MEDRDIGLTVGLLLGTALLVVGVVVMVCIVRRRRKHSLHVGSLISQSASSNDSLPSYVSTSKPHAGTTGTAGTVGTDDIDCTATTYSTATNGVVLETHQTHSKSDVPESKDKSKFNFIKKLSVTRKPQSITNKKSGTSKVKTLEASSALRADASMTQGLEGDGSDKTNEEDEVIPEMSEFAEFGIDYDNNLIKWPSPGERVKTLPADDNLTSLPADDNTGPVPADDNTGPVPADDNTGPVPSAMVDECEYAVVLPKSLRLKNNQEMSTSEPTDNSPAEFPVSGEHTSQFTHSPAYDVNQNVRPPPGELSRPTSHTDEGNENHMAAKHFISTIDVIDPSNDSDVRRFDDDTRLARVRHSRLDDVMRASDDVTNGHRRDSRETSRPLSTDHTVRIKVDLTDATSHETFL